MSRCLALGLLALSMLACAVALLPAHASARAPCPNEDSTFAAGAPALRASVLCLVNVTRLGGGLPALQRDARLEAAAQLHTDDMIGRGLTHIGSDGSQYYERILATGYPLAVSDSGETIAQGYQTPAAVVDGWLKSLGHCQAILMPGIRDLGVGVNPGRANTAYPGPTWTQVLARTTSEPALSTNTGPRDGCPYALAAPSVGPALSTQPPLPGVAVTGLKVSPSKFRAAKFGASVSTSAIGNRVRTGVSYTLSHAASVRFSVQRSSDGRRVDGRCVKTTRSNRSRTRCTRYVRVSGSFTRNRGAGTDRFTFSGRIGGRALKPGRYRLLATPGAGRTVRATFRVIK